MGLFSLVYVCSMALVVNSLICLDQLKEKPGVYEPIKLADDGKHFCFVGLMLENDVCSAKTGYKVLDKAYKNEVPPCSREGTTVDCLCKEDKCNVRVANLQNKLIEGIVEGGYNGKVLPKFLRCIKEFSSHTWHPLSVATSIRPSRLSSLSSFSTPGSSKTASKLLVSQTSPSTVSMDEKSSTENSSTFSPVEPTKRSEKPTSTTSRSAEATPKQSSAMKMSRSSSTPYVDVRQTSKSRRSATTSTTVKSTSPSPALFTRSVEVPSTPPFLSSSNDDQEKKTAAEESEDSGWPDWLQLLVFLVFAVFVYFPLWMLFLRSI